ncbi:hypothetical protein [Cupriavidus sp. Marseille-Q8015]
MSAFDKLDAAMDAYDARKAEERSQAEARQLAADRFTAECSNFLTLTAHPVLEQIGNHLKMRGHDFSIQAPQGELRISLIVFPSGTGKAALGYGVRSDHPTFTIVGDSASQRLKFQTVIKFPSGGSRSGGDGDCSLKEATAEMLRDRVIRCIAQSFGG